MAFAVALTSLTPLINSGVISVQDGLFHINQTVFLRLPAEDQQAAFRRLFLQLVRNDGDHEITAQIQRWALKPVLQADEAAKRDFLKKLEAEIARIFKPAETTVEATPKEAPAATASRPAQKFYPEFWDKLPRTVRIRLMRHSIEEKLEPGEQPHGVFLAKYVSEWLEVPDERNLADAEAVLEAVNREPAGFSLHHFFWETAYHHPTLGTTLDAWLHEPDISSRRRILRAWVSGLIVHLTEPLTHSRVVITPEERANPACTLHPKWQSAFTVSTRRFLARMAGRNLFPTLEEDPARHGRLLAQGIIATGRYALSLDAKSVGRPVLQLREDESLALREILIFACDEATSDRGDWLFLRAFWTKLAHELKDGQTKGTLSTLIMALMLLEHKKSDVFPKRP